MMTWSAHLSMLFTEHPFIERPAAARAAGFAAAEVWWPSHEVTEAWVAAVVASSLRIVLINADAGRLERGERGFLNVPDRREDSLRRFAKAVRLAHRVGAPRINVLVGRSRPGVSLSDQMAAARVALRDCGKLAAEAGVTVLVENINGDDVPGYLVPRPRDVADLIEAVDVPSVRMLYDAYHAARAGSDPKEDVASFIELIDHVQFADCPGRGAPGTGRTAFWPFVQRLADLGYRGAVGLEYDPQGPTASSLDFLGTRLVPLPPIS
jgi:hydroxypyruvate isomerase